MASLDLSGKKGFFLGLLALLLIAAIFYGGLVLGQHRANQETAGADAGEAAAGALAAAGDAAGDLLPADQDPVFAIQVGNFMVKANCETVLADLQERGYPAYVVQIKDGERLLHRIHVGPYPSFEEAEIAAQDFTREEEIDAIPIRARSGPVTPVGEAEEGAETAQS